MKIVLLCGGKGVRYSSDKPKALALIGNFPIIYHLINSYVLQGYNDFVIALGWKQEEIKDYFFNNLNNSDLKRFNIEFVDTGQETHTAKRLKLIENIIPKEDDSFFCNYCDGLANVDLTKLQVRHLTHKNIATLTAVRPVNQFGELIFDDNGSVIKFEEKPRLKEYINGGFFLFDRKIFDYIDTRKNQELEKDVLVKLAEMEELGAYKHEGFWETLNNNKDEIRLNEVYDKCIKENIPLPWNLI